MASGADLAGALEAAISDPGPIPSTGSDLVRFAGGRKALTQQLSGMERAPAKRDYPDQASWRAASTRWRSASRRAQRWDDEGKPGKQRRGTSRATLTDEQRGRVRAKASERKWSRLVSKGIAARMRALVVVDSPKSKTSDARIRDLPSGGGGVLISPADTNEILRELEDQGADAAAELFTGIFLENHHMGDLDVELEDVEWLKIWAQGDNEPPL